MCVGSSVCIGCGGGGGGSSVCIGCVSWGYICECMCRLCELGGVFVCAHCVCVCVYVHDS